MKPNKVKTACKNIAEDVNRLFKNLTIYFIVHSNEYGDAINLASQEILFHPAASTALKTLSEPTDNNQSSVLGIIYANQSLLAGMANRESYLALCTVNIKNYRSFTETMRYVYHMVWHVINGYKAHTQSLTAKREQVSLVTGEKTPLDIMRDNLKADIFSAVTMYLQGDKTAFRKIGQQRAKKALMRNPHEAPEYYAYPLAVDTGLYIMSKKTSPKDVKRLRKNKKKQLETACDIAEKIGNIFDDDSLRGWIAFCIPAQTMAWKNFAQRDILSAAIHTSDDTNVRSIAHMVSEITKIEPTSILQIKNNYSAFNNQTLNDEIYSDTNSLIEKNLANHKIIPGRFGSIRPINR